MKYYKTCHALHQEIQVYSNDEIIKINDDIYCFVEDKRNIRYLIIGSKRAALIDTGYGYKNPWKQIRSITNLPLMVVCTHGDPDHALGSRWFSKVYIHQCDLHRALENDRNTEEKIRNINYYHRDVDGFQALKELFLTNTLNEDQFILLQDKDQLDLGDRLLEIIHTPAHTFGSVSVYDSKDKYLFIGDNASYDDLWLFCLGTRVPPFSSIKAAYMRLKTYDFQQIFGAHGKQPIHKEMIDEIIACIDDLRDNHNHEEINSSRFITRITNGSIVYNHYYGSVKLVYTKEMLDEMLSNEG